MKRWLGLALAGLGVCLLLVLGHPGAGKGADNHPCIARWGRSVGPWGDPALPWPPAAAARKAMPRQAHTATSESRAVHLVLFTERDVGPPWLDSRGPPGKVCGTLVDSRAAGKTGSLKQGGAMLPQPGPSAPWQAPPQEGGFATAFS
jgi:hypothetical protein